jgi:hypothetical protein
LFEIKKVTRSRDDKKEWVVVNEKAVAEGEVWLLPFPFDYRPSPLSAAVSLCLPRFPFDCHASL